MTDVQAEGLLSLLMREVNPPAGEGGQLSPKFAKL